MPSVDTLLPIQELDIWYHQHSTNEISQTSAVLCAWIELFASAQDPQNALGLRYSASDMNLGVHNLDLSEMVVYFPYNLLWSLIQ